MTIGERTYTILYPGLLRPLHPDERERLASSVRTHGVQTPVIVDEDGGVIDGANRLSVAAELGLDGVPTVVRPGLTDQQKLAIALELNDARRHLSQADRREAQAAAERLRAGRVARVAEMRRKGKSLRTIAGEEGVSLGQVQRDLRDATTVSGDTVAPQSGKVICKVGRERPATRPRPPVGDS